MNITFWKMHGAANDFILVDDRGQTFPAHDRNWLVRLCARRTGVGSDGVLLIQPSATADFRMRFFNPDGGEADMCGNGARCIARLAREIGAAPERMTIETAAGPVRAEMQGEQVLLHLTDPRDLRVNQSLEVDGHPLTYHAVNTGVPHAVIEVSDLDRTMVHQLGAFIRHHPAFAPAGTNVNFVTFTGPDALRVRTYERGVEAETRACGTGIVAAAVAGGRLGQVTAPVQVTPASGDRLVVNYRLDDGRVSGVTLLGPAVFVCQGNVEYSH
jgi:diaminopimelate epimerase